MKVKGIMFYGFAAAILTGTAHAATPFNIASKAYVDQQVTAEATTRGTAVSELDTRVGSLETSMNSMTGSGEDSVAGQIAAALGADFPENSTVKDQLDLKQLKADSNVTDLAQGSHLTAGTGVAGNLKALDTNLRTAEGNITSLQGLVGDTSVSTQISNAVAVETSAREAADTALDGRLDTIEGSGAGSVAKAEADAKAYTDAQIGGLAENQTVATTYQTLGNKVTSLAGDFADDTQYPSAKAVKAALTSTGTDVSGLDTRVTAIEGYSTAYTSGIDSTKVAQIATNANNISDLSSNKQDKSKSTVAEAAAGTYTAITAGDGVATNLVNLDSHVKTAESAITTLTGNASTAGSVAKAEADAKAYADGKFGGTATALPAKGTCSSTNGKCVLTIDKTSGDLTWIDVTSPIDVPAAPGGGE